MKRHDNKLSINKLRKTYGAVIALDNVDLDLREGEFLTMLGPSGSGKSTLLWAVAGLNAPDSGNIWIDGKEATYASPRVNCSLQCDLNDRQSERGNPGVGVAAVWDCSGRSGCAFAVEN